MRKLRVLALMHDYLVPPKDVDGVDLSTAKWKMEYDVTHTLEVMGHDVRALLRQGAGDEEISAAIGALWGRRTDRYSELRTAATARLDKVEMSYIGG